MMFTVTDNLRPLPELFWSSIFGSLPGGSREELCKRSGYCKQHYVLVTGILWESGRGTAVGSRSAGVQGTGALADVGFSGLQVMELANMRNKGGKARFWEKARKCFVQDTKIPFKPNLTLLGAPTLSLGEVTNEEFSSLLKSYVRFLQT